MAGSAYFIGESTDGAQQVGVVMRVNPNKWTCWGRCLGFFNERTTSPKIVPSLPVPSFPCLSFPEQLGGYHNFLDVFS